MSNGVFVEALLNNRSIWQLRSLANFLELPTKNINIKDTHITMAHSKEALYNTYQPLKNLNIPVKCTRVAYIGNYLAVLVESQWLRDQWLKLKMSGAIWDFSGYIPHVSIAKNPPLDLPLHRVNHFVPEMRLVITSTNISKLKV